MTDATFREKYGPWAVVAGASDGVGAAYARAMAARGLNVVLLARRRAVLDELAAELRSAHGVEARAEPIDLATPDAAATVLERTNDLEVGMLMYNAGADPYYQHFLDYEIEPQLAMIQRNCVVPTVLCHHYAGEMKTRGRGGIVLVSSSGGTIGMRQMVVYGGTKAFDLVFGEALWSEVSDSGVDVLVPILGATDTLAFRQLQARRGLLADENDQTQLPDVMTSEDVADGIIANLADGPSWYAGESARRGGEGLRTMARNEAVRAVRAAPSVYKD
jgi:short-subunit dehydrogenase